VDLPPLSAFPNVLSFDYANVGREYILRSPFGKLVSLDLSHMRDSFVQKIVLSSAPTDDPEFAAVAVLTSHDLAVCRHGDSRWTFVEGASSYTEDVIYRDGSFHALHKSGRVAVFSPSSAPEVSFVEAHGRFQGDLHYLVSAGEDWLLVTRYLKIQCEDEPHLAMHKTAGFDVFKLDRRIESGPRWVKMTDLGDYMLFVGRNSSLALRASEFPGCEGDCIYFTDDYSEYNSDWIGEPDVGIYRLWDGGIEPLPCYPQSTAHLIRPQPIWLTRNPR
ncbi:hypothetical protein CRG98_042508, partial [Punica granatum]